MKPLVVLSRPRGMTWTLMYRSAPVVAALLLTGACGSATGRPGGTATSASSAGPGESVKFALYSHCGVESARINGHWWHADPPLYNDDHTGPPDGWDNPYQQGRLTVESPDRAVFTAVGREVVFVPAASNEPVRVCE